MSDDQYTSPTFTMACPNCTHPIETRLAELRSLTVLRCCACQHPMKVDEQFRQEAEALAGCREESAAHAPA